MALVVNGEFVEDQRFVQVFRDLCGREIDSAGSVGPEHAAALRPVVERRVVQLVLLRQMAAQAGLTISAEEVSARRNLRWGTSSASVCGVAVQQQLADELLVEKYGRWLSRHEPHPSRLEVEQYYLRHRAEFAHPERVNTTHILCNVEPPTREDAARTRMEQAEQELERGTPFAKVASRYSDCGGTVILGWVARGTMVPEFEDVVFALPEGGRSGIFRTIFGFHIAMVLAREPEGFESLADLRQVLARRMLEERRQRVVEAASERALQTASIEVVPAAREGR